MKRTEGEIRISRGAQADPFSLEAESQTIAHMKLTRTPFECEGNAKHIEALWNASKDIPTKQAVAYLRHGAEMENLLIRSKHHCVGIPLLYKEIEELLTKLEADNGG